MCRLSRRACSLQATVWRRCRHSLSNCSELCAAILKYLAQPERINFSGLLPFCYNAANEVNAFPLAGACGSTALLKPCAQASGPTMRKNL